MFKFQFDNYSPEFKSFGPEVLESALYNGAAKISGIISTSSVNYLRKQDQKFDQSTIRRQIPELVPFLDLLAVDDSSPFKCERYIVLPVGDEIVDAHIDGDSTAKDSEPAADQLGVSLLIPILGGSALFAAHEFPFCSTDSPSFVVEYGLGDAMLVRQEIHSVNGVADFFPAATHLGISESYRVITVLDYMEPDLMLPAAASASATTAT